MNKFDQILLVDDDYISNLLTRLLIEDLHLARQILVATHGEEALALIREHCLPANSNDTSGCPVLILLDINMPVMDGFEFLEAFSQLKAQLPVDVHVIMLTSSLNTKDLARASQYKIAGYLEKPLTEEKLQSVLS